MDKIFLLPILFLSFAIGACSGNSNPSEGEYQQTVKITKLDLPGLAEADRKQQIEQLEQASNAAVTNFCIKSGDQWKEAPTRMSNMFGGNCETTKDVGAANNIDLQMTCTETVNGDVKISMAGAAHGTGYQTDMSFNFKDPASDETATLAMDISAKRVGDCPG